MGNNSLQLKVKLDIKDTGVITTQLSQLENKLRAIKLKVDFNLGESQQILDKKIDRLSKSLKSLKLVGDLDYNKTKTNIDSKVNKIAKDTKATVNIDAKIDKNAVNSSIKDISKTAKSTGGIDLFDIEQFKKKMELAVKQLDMSKSHKFKNGELDGFLTQVNSITKDTPNARQEMQKLNLQLKEISVNGKEVDTSMGTALKGILMWSVATTAFFAPIKLLQSMTQEVLNVDKAMTDLKRVMDATPQQYNDMLSSSVAMSKDLGNNVSDTLNALNEVARSYGDLMSQGDMLKLTKASMVASNVSDLSSEDAMQSLIGTMNAYKMSASSAMSIIDKFNEVDNNFSVSTTQIAESMSRASSVGKVYGVTLDQLVGYTTAIGSVTMESGTILGRALKTILSRITTMDGSISALKSVGISIHDMGGQVKPVNDILAELAGKWSSLTDEQRQNMGVTLAGRDQLTRFLALMENWQMGIQATNTSLTSQNSAVKENEKYQQSLEARINKLKTTFTELSVAVGDAFLKDDLVAGIQALTDLTASSAKFMSGAGALPVLLGTISAGVVLMSKNLRNLGVAGTFGAKGLTETQLASIGLEKGMTRANIATKILSVSLKGLLISTGVGIVIAGISFALEKLVGSTVSANNALDDFKRQQADNVQAYVDNKDSISSLASQYEDLDKKISSGKYTSDELKKHGQLANELSTVMPSLIVGEDSYKNKVIGSTESVNAKIALMERQVSIQEKINALQDKEKVETNFDDAKKALDGLQSKLDSMASGVSTAFGNMNIDQITAKFQELQDKMADGSKLSSIDQKDFDFYGRILEEYGSLKNETDIAKSAYQQATMEMINSNLALDNSTSEATKSMINDFQTFVATTDGISTDRANKILGDLLNESKNSAEFKGNMKKYSDAVTELQDALSNGETDTKALDKLKKNVDKALGNIKKSFNSLGSMKGVKPESLKGINSMLDSTSNSSAVAERAGMKLGATTKETTDKLREQAQSANETGDALDGMSDSANGASDSEETLAQKVNKLSNAHEQMVGASQGSIDTTVDMISVYKTLTAVSDSLGKTQSLSKDQTIALADATNYLSATYPDLVNGAELNIKAMQKEAEANDILLQAVEKSKNGSITAQQQKTLNHAIATKGRINDMITEIQSLEALNEAYKQKWSNKDLANTPGAMFASTSEMRALEESNKKLNLDQANLAKQRAILYGLTGKLSTSMNISSNVINKNTSSTNKNTKSKKSNNSTTSQSIYVTDKYRQSMEKLNGEMDKQQKIIDKNASSSKAYRNAKREQIKILQKEYNLTKSQVALLDKQIKNGTILQTGSVTVKKKTKVSKASNSSSSNLGYTGKYSSTIKKYAQKYKVNPNLIASIIKQESGFNSNARSGAGAMGLMQLMPGTARGLGVKNAYNPEQNIAGGTKYISQLLKQYGGNIEKALRAYNAGSGNLAKSYGFKETNNYVKKVTANYSAYLKKASGSVTTVSKSAIKNMQTTVSKSTNRKLAGWSGKVTQSYKQHGYAIDMDGKKGQKLESNVNGKVKFAGKGTGVNKSYGNYVVVTGSNGKQYLYAHLDATSVKKGDSVKVGQKLGTIGNTGNVVKGKGGDGSHLHYEVRDKNGKRIDPTASLNYAKTTRSVKGYTSASMSGVATKSKQAVDEAKSDLEKLKQDLAQQGLDISDLELDVVNSQIEYYKNQTDNYDRKIESLKIDAEGMDTMSKAYRDNLRKQNKYNADIKKSMSKEIKYMEDRIKNDKLLTKKQKEELKIQLANLKNDYKEVNKVIAKNTSDINQSIFDNLEASLDKTAKNAEKRMKKIEDRIHKNSTMSVDDIKNSPEARKLATYQGLVKKNKETLAKQKAKKTELLLFDRTGKSDKEIADNSKKIIAYNVSISKTTASLKKNEKVVKDLTKAVAKLYSNNLIDNQDKLNEYLKERSETLNDIVKIQKDLKKYKSDKNMVKQLQALLEQSQTKLDGLNLDIFDQEQVIKSIYETTADAYVETMKSALEKVRDAELKSLDEVRKKQEEAHNQKSKYYQDELDYLSQIYDAINKNIDREEATLDFNKSLTEEQKDLKKLQDELSKLSMDDSYESKAKQTDIKQQIADKQNSIADLQHKREVDLRKQSLQDDYDANKKNIEDKQKVEDDAYDKQTKALDKQQKEIEDHYDELLNDERYWASERQKIIDGSVTDATKSLTTISGEIDKNTALIGTSISNNVTDSINEAIGQLQALGSGFDDIMAKTDATIKKQDADNKKKIDAINKPATKTPTTNNTTTKKPTTTTTKKPTTTTKKTTTTTTKKPTTTTTKPVAKKDPTTTSAVYLRSSSAYGNNIMLTIPKGKAVDYLGMSNGWAKVKYSGKTGYMGKSFLKFHDGGIVGKSKGTNNKLTELANKLFNTNSNEQVIKSLKGELQIPPKNIPNIFDTMNKLITSVLPSTNTPNIKVPDISNNTPSSVTGDTYEVNVTIGSMNGDKKSADIVGEQILTKIKRKRGGRFS